MSKQHNRRRRVRRAAARTLAIGAAVAALVAVLGAGPALAIQAPPDERILERQGRVNHQLSVGQAGEQGKAEEPSQQKATELPRRWIRPEPDMGPPPQLDEQTVPTVPTPVREAPDSGRGGLVAAMVVTAVLLLVVAAAATWRIRHRRPQPESTQPESTQPESTQPELTQHESSA
jgi:hypothetical protein